MEWGDFRPVLRTVLGGASVLGYLGSLSPVLFFWLANQRSDAHLVAHSAPAVGILVVFLLPFTISLGGSFLSMAVSIPGEGGRFTVPAATFTSSERRLLFAGGGLLPLTGVLLLFALLPTFWQSTAGYSDAGGLLMMLGLALLAIVMGYISMIGLLLRNTPPSKSSERAVGVIFLLLAVLGILTGFSGGFLILIILALAIPVTVLVIGYTRSRPPESSGTNDEVTE
jgi:hypothetical protein